MAELERVSIPSESDARARAFDMRRMLPLLLLCACGGESKEAPRVELPVLVDGSRITEVTTDLGYAVTLGTARLAIANMQFTVAGEAHTASLLERLFVSKVHAHPGHYQGGEVTGELVGAYVVDWLAHDGEELGLATLIAGDYQAINFDFARATAAEVDSGDPLLGHTAQLEGTAVKGEVSVRFSVLLDAPAGRQLVGLPFEETITASTDSAVGFELTTVDPFENDTLFDGLDFASLPVGEDGVARVSEASRDAPSVAFYTLLRRTFQTHDHFEALPLTRKNDR